MHFSTIVNKESLACLLLRFISIAGFNLACLFFCCSSHCFSVLLLWCLVYSMQYETPLLVFFPLLLMCCDSKSDAVTLICLFFSKPTFVILCLCLFDLMSPWKYLSSSHQSLKVSKFKISVLRKDLSFLLVLHMNDVH